MHNRRHDERLNVENGIAVHVIQPDGNPPGGDSAFLRLTSNISKRGLQFNHSHPIAVGTDLRIHLSLDMPRKFVTHLGKVRWNESHDEGEPASIGVEFTETEPNDMQIWEDFVMSRALATA